jgi:SAM-dependent methyltransferase
MVSSAQSNTLKAYDAIAPVYAEYSEKYQHYLSAIESLVCARLKPGMRLLDVGSGDGRRLHAICTHVGLRDVVAVEPSAQMAALCRKATGFTVYETFADRVAGLNEAPFDAITALWNVFGHMPGSEVRAAALAAMLSMLKPGGILMLDVNNRHNQLAYGRWNVLKRRIIDALVFDEKRGDAHYEWKIGDQSYPASGHLFTPAEMNGLFAKAGLRVMERFCVHYRTGDVSASPYNGQLFYVLARR